MAYNDFPQYFYLTHSMLAARPQLVDIVWPDGFDELEHPNVANYYWWVPEEHPAYAILMLMYPTQRTTRISGRSKTAIFPRHSIAK